VHANSFKAKNKIALIPATSRLKAPMQAFPHFIFRTTTLIGTFCGSQFGTTPDHTWTTDFAFH